MSNLKKIESSTPFSEFIRNASYAKKKKVYTKVLEEASALQLAVLEKAKKHVA